MKAREREREREKPFSALDVMLICLGQVSTKRSLSGLNCAQRVVTVLEGVGLEGRGVGCAGSGRAGPCPFIAGSRAVIASLSRQLPIITPGSVDPVQRSTKRKDVTSCLPS